LHVADAIERYTAGEFPNPQLSTGSSLLVIRITSVAVVPRHGKVTNSVAERFRSRPYTPSKTPNSDSRPEIGKRFQKPVVYLPVSVYANVAQSFC
jgi:hypothetical protein